MTNEEKRLAKDGPMTCPHEDCAAFRKREPEFAKKLHDAGIIAHYTGFSGIFGEEYWMLDGITPVSRASLTRMLKYR